MNRFVQLTAPAYHNLPARLCHFNINHIVSAAPRYVVHPEDHVKPVSEKRYIEEGTWIETSRSGDDAMVHVTEQHSMVMLTIYLSQEEVNNG